MVNRKWEIMNNKQWHQNGMPIMMIDAETDGLYGSVLSIAAMVVDGKNQVTETFYKEIDLKKCEIKNLWVQKNLISIRTQKNILDSEEILLEKFWQFWEKYYTNVYGIADVAYPVEDRLTLSPYRERYSA